MTERRKNSPRYLCKQIQIFSLDLTFTHTSFVIASTILWDCFVCLPPSHPYGKLSYFGLTSGGRPTRVGLDETVPREGTREVSGYTTPTIRRDGTRKDGRLEEGPDGKGT